ncbi:alpha/beta hydrolase [Cellulomonas soli]|uniref:alpha/beta hydrolase n=1 Tax=Cellulomonas soli TaxID=931535 RepID=UPI003F83BD10
MPSAHTTGGWETDRLVPDWQARTLTLRPRDGQQPVATLVRRTPMGPATAVAALHVHGYNDYVFQAHVADALTARGVTFYGLDLRRCGRSTRPGDVPHYTDDLTEYHEDLEAAVRLLREELGHERVVLVGHSTGGLSASLWAATPTGSELVDALVLNSPWLDLDASWFARVISTRALDFWAPRDPLRVLADGPSAYSHHLHVQHGGRWDYDLALKPPSGFPVRAGWLRAVRRGHADVGRGLDLQVPVLVCSAGRSGPNTPDNPDLDAQDTILDVRRIAARAPGLGRDVTYVPVPGGIHDLSLSAARPRETYLRTMLSWVDAQVPVRR